MRSHLLFVSLVLALHLPSERSFAFDYQNPAPTPAFCCNNVTSGPVDINSAYVNLATFARVGGVTEITNGYARLSDLLNAASNSSATSAQLAAVSNQLVGIGNQLSIVGARASRAIEVAATAAAMRDAIPNAGDRWALRFNMAGVDGYVAGAVGMSVNISDRARISVNYGRSESQNVISGGLNLSFR